MFLPRLIAAGLALALAAGCSSSGGEGERHADLPADAGPVGTVPVTTTTAPTTTTTAPPRSFTLAATGDLLLHAPLWRQAAANAGGTGYDFAPMLAAVAPELSAADLAICHMETPMARDGAPLSSYPVFSVPGALAPAVAGAGYDSCSTSSNHAIDRGAEGVAATLEHLDAAGVRHTGTARSPEESAAPTLLTAGGVTVGHLSYSYGFNGFTLPAATPWLANLIDPARIVEDARRLRAAGAEVVVVSLHWGVENQHQPTAEQSLVARAILASPDVDLLLGHHAHVVQPIERIGDEYVVYGMGNFLSNQSAACCPAATQDGVIVHLTLTERRRKDGFRVSALRYTPTLVERGSYRIVPIPAALADPATPASVRPALEASAARTTAVIGSLGVVPS